jgi:hypothetical protein
VKTPPRSRGGWRTHDRAYPYPDRAFRNPAIPDNPNLARRFSLRELAEKTGLPPRGLQFWTDNGLLLTDNPVVRPGRGVHRYYAPVEVQVAALLAPLAAAEVPAGVLQKFAVVFRACLTNAPLAEMPSGLVVDDWRETSRAMFRAARGEGRNYLLVPYFVARPTTIRAITDETGSACVDLGAIYPQDFPYGAGLLLVIEMTAQLAPLFA